MKKYSIFTEQQVTKHAEDLSEMYTVSMQRAKENKFTFFDVLLTVHLSIFISVIKQLYAQNFCFTVSSFHASTCFEHMCSSSGGQNCITQRLVSSHL